MANPALQFPMTPVHEQTNYPRHAFYKDVNERWTVALDTTPAISSGVVPVAVSATGYNCTAGIPDNSVLEAADPEIAGFVAAVGVRGGLVAHVYALTIIVTCTGLPPVLLEERIMMVISP
jgi:hypothetical protein